MIQNLQSRIQRTKMQTVTFISIAKAGDLLLTAAENALHQATSRARLRAVKRVTKAILALGVVPTGDVKHLATGVDSHGDYGILITTEE